MSIGLGAVKRVEGGYLFLDDVELYYHGNYEFGIDAYNTDKSKVKIYENTERRTFNLCRNLPKDEWNALILPVNLAAAHVTSVFGSGAQLLKLVGLYQDKPSWLMFQTVDLSNGNNRAVDAGEFYLVKVTDAPDENPNMETAEKYPFWLAGSDTPDEENGIIKRYETINYDGPVFHFAGVTSANLAEENMVVTKSGGDFKNIPAGHTLTATGYYYRPTADNEIAQAGEYVMSGGKMYHLTSSWNGLVGTSWKLRYTNSQGKVLSLYMNPGGNETTGIQVIEGGVIDGANAEAARGVYNLSGQKVSEGTSLEGLSKGIYVVNGRKVVLK